jgi:hypothetical protein
MVARTKAIRRRDSVVKNRSGKQIKDYLEEFSLLTGKHKNSPDFLDGIPRSIFVDALRYINELEQDVPRYYTIQYTILSPDKKEHQQGSRYKLLRNAQPVWDEVYKAAKKENQYKNRIIKGEFRRADGKLIDRFQFE